MIRTFVLMLAVVCLTFTVPATSWAAVGNAAPKPAGIAAVVNVNTAGVKELQTLPEVGKVTAERIVEYRTAQGPFKSAEELLKVKGIGKKVLEKIRASIILE
jgi:competence protein ComEA